MKLCIVNYPYSNPNNPNTIGEVDNPSEYKEYLKSRYEGYDPDHYDACTSSSCKESDFSSDRGDALIFETWESWELVSAYLYAVMGNCTQYVEIEQY